MNEAQKLTARLTRPLVQVGRAACRFVFPLSCPRCHVDVEPQALDSGEELIAPVLCRRCTGEVLPPPGNRCRRCGVPLGPHVRSDNGCVWCRSQRFHFERVIRLGLYDESMRNACIRAKSSTQAPLAAALANLLWLTEWEDLMAAAVDLVVPVPQFLTRRLARPHHAAETISRVLAQRLGRPHRRTLLRKIRFTADQSELTSAERRVNLKDAFTAWPHAQSLTGKTVLLVDDLLTTGSTANECARTLRNAGAKQVVVAVIAVVP
jgi:ComF family protein